MMLLALTLAATVASPEADEGVKAFAEGRYEDAARILGQAYEAEPEPELLFAWAQAERYAGHCDEAVPLYREYLEGDPPDDVQQLAREAIVECGEDPDAPAEDAEVEPPPPEGARPPGDSGPSIEPGGERPPRRPLRDPLGHALTWSGVAVAAVGVGLLGEAHRRRVEGERAPDEQAYRDALAGAPTLSRAGIAVAVGGAALLVAGVVRLSMLAGREERERSALRLTGTGVVWKFELAPRGLRALR